MICSKYITLQIDDFSYDFSIRLDCKITLEKRLKGIYVTAEKLQEARQNLVQAGKEVPIK